MRYHFERMVVTQKDLQQHAQRSNLSLSESQIDIHRKYWVEICMGEKKSESSCGFFIVIGLGMLQDTWLPMGNPAISRSESVTKSGQSYNETQWRIKGFWHLLCSCTVIGISESRQQLGANDHDFLEGILNTNA